MGKVASNVWIDASGKTRQTILNTATGQSAILAEIESLTNAGLVQSWEATPDNPNEIGVNDTFSSVRDYVKVLFSCADGSEASVTVPAPIAGLFLADGQTLDASAVSGLATACIGQLRSASGSLAESLLGGMRRNGNGSEYLIGAGDMGTVTSVGLSMPAPFSVSGSPVTSSGTIDVGYDPTIQDGTLIIGKTSDHSMGLGLITAGSNITVTNGPHSIEIAASGSLSLEVQQELALTNVDIPSGGTWTTMVSLPLTAGTWLVMSQLVFYDGAETVKVTSKMTDDVTVVCEGESVISFVGTATTITLTGVYLVPSGTPTLKLEGASNGTTTAMVAAIPDYSTVGAPCSGITAVKIG